jgi:large subunit ribosomal protein L10
MATPDKVTAVKAMAEQFRASSAVFVTEYRGLTVPQLAELRRSLRGVATFSVAKNTLIALAAKEAKVEGLDSLFAGPTAIAYVTGDPVAVAKSLRDFGQTYPALVLKGGIFEGKVLSVTEVNYLASLESRETLLAKTAYMLLAPIAKAARAIDALRMKQEAAA